MVSAASQAVFEWERQLKIGPRMMADRHGGLQLHALVLLKAWM
jgi:hypothetical protein